MAEKLYKATAEGRVEIPEDEAAEIRAERAANKAKREATAWLRHRTEGKVTSHRDENNNRIIDSREEGYPPITDQLDQIYHEGIDAWKETVQAVKDAHPKPE